MERSYTVRLIAVVDIVLASLGIISETLSLIFQGNKLQLLSSVVSPHPHLTISPNQSGLNGNGTDMEKDDWTNLSSADNSKFLAFVVLVSIIFGVFFMQLFMATKLFSASKKMRALQALQKFSCWRIWSFVLICILILMLTIVLIFSIERRLVWTDWVLYIFLSIQILFRSIAIYYISLCRKKVKDNLVHPAFIFPTHIHPHPPPHLQ